MNRCLKNSILVVVFMYIQFGFAQIEVCHNCEVKSLTDAVAMAVKHETILIKQGVYNEHDILIDKPLKIIGEKKATIDGDEKGYIFIIKADSVSISGLTLKNVGQSYTKDFAAIYISRSNYFTIENCTLENVFFGLLVEKSHYGAIRFNTISSTAEDQASSGNGIHLWHCSNIIVNENDVHHLRDGIYLEFVEHSKIIKNKSHNNLRYGLHFMFSNNDEYHENTFTNNGSGVAVMFSKFIKMTKNKFEKNWGTASYGLLLKEIYDAEIIRNSFEQNTIAIFTEGSTRVNYLNNSLIRNGWGIKISGACYTNIFKQNNFLNNAFDLSYNSKLNDNSFDENYWSSYTGYDLDKDGLGDVPYRPVKLFSYVVNTTPETLVLLRSLFVDLINFSEKVSPVFTPDNLVDHTPLMRPIP